MKKGKEGAPLWKRALPGFVAGMVNGLFGGGGGLLLVPMLRHLSHLECHKAHATAIGHHGLASRRSASWST